MKTKIHFLFLFLLFLPLGCNDNSILYTIGHLKLSLNKNNFNINEQIFSTLSNQTNSSTFLYHCNFIFTPEVEKKGNDSWILYSSPICKALYKSGVTDFEAGKESKNKGSINEVGIYRLKFSYGFSGNNLDKSVYSEGFVVE